MKQDLLFLQIENIQIRLMSYKNYDADSEMNYHKYFISGGFFMKNLVRKVCTLIMVIAMLTPNGIIHGEEATKYPAFPHSTDFSTASSASDEFTDISKDSNWRSEVKIVYTERNQPTKLLLSVLQILRIFIRSTPQPT